MASCSPHPSRYKSAQTKLLLLEMHLAYRVLVRMWLIDVTCSRVPARSASMQVGAAMESFMLATGFYEKYDSRISFCGAQ
jgi:hypothetical protein